MNELPRIEAFLYQTLSADPALDALVGDRIFGYEIPQGADFPLVQFVFSAGQDVQGNGTHRNLSRPLYQIKAIGRSQLSPTLVQIADRIDEVLQNASAIGFDGVVISARRDQPISYQEAGGEFETSFRHIGGLYRIDVYAGASAGAPVNYPPASFEPIHVTDEIPIGAIDGGNAAFETQFNFDPETIEVTLNGIGQRRHVDYIIKGISEFEFTESPEVGDFISVDYIRA